MWRIMEPLMSDNGNPLSTLVNVKTKMGLGTSLSLSVRCQKLTLQLLRLLGRVGVNSKTSKLEMRSQGALWERSMSDGTFTCRYVCRPLSLCVSLCLLSTDSPLSPRLTVMLPSTTRYSDCMYCPTCAAGKESPVTKVCMFALK